MIVVQFHVLLMFSCKDCITPSGEQIKYKMHNMFILYLVPTTYGLSLIAHHVQIVGQSLTLECSVTTVRGITSTVNFVWSRNGTVLKDESKLIEDFTIQNLDIYTDTYTISPLSVLDDGRIYQCEVVIETSPPVTATDNVTLDVTGM